MSETLTRRPEGPYLIESSPNYAMYRLMRLVRLNDERGADRKEAMSKSAEKFLKQAAKTMRQRGKQYDPSGAERSIGKAVAIFNTKTGRDLTEAEGWLLLQDLKDVRQWATTAYHEDSALDCIAYAALKAEALSAGSQPVEKEDKRTSKLRKRVWMLRGAQKAAWIDRVRHVRNQAILAGQTKPTRWRKKR